VLSPYGSWLAISNSPTGDSFSHWFRGYSDRNIHYEDKLELGIQSETDAKGNPVFRHFNDEFFPVDGRGWGAEGQRDCFTNALRNYGYVSSNISNTRDSVSSGYPNTEKKVENATRSGVFLTKFEVSG